MKNDYDLFFTCSLIEYIGRECKLERGEVVKHMGKECLKRIYKYAGTLHCEPIEKVADDYITICNIPQGTYDNVTKCKYEVPDYWTIGDVYGRLIEDVIKENVIDTLMEIYQSWISNVISNYNSDFFYQSREYICKCYEANEILL